MRGWIFFPEKQKPYLPNRFHGFPGMNFPYESDDEESDGPDELLSGRIQGNSLGFYCGPAAGETSSVFPSLLEGISKYPRSEYKPVFQPTKKIWEILPPITLKVSAEPPAYLWTVKAFQKECVVVNGSFPRLMADMFVRGCRTFLFSPYVLK